MSATAISANATGGGWDTGYAETTYFTPPGPYQWPQPTYPAYYYTFPIWGHTVPSKCPGCGRCNVCGKKDDE